MNKKTKRSSRARMSNRRANRHASATVAREQEQNLMAHYQSLHGAMLTAGLVGLMSRRTK